MSVHWEKLNFTQYIPDVPCFLKELSVIPQCIHKTSNLALGMVLFLSIDVGQSLGNHWHNSSVTGFGSLQLDWNLLLDLDMYQSVI